MVHALEKAHALLEPNGLLLSIHPLPDLAEITVRVAADSHIAGYLNETDDRIRYGQAEAAVAAVMERGLFAIERQEVFAYSIHTASVTELQDFLAENWKRADLDDLVAMRAHDLLQTTQRDAELVITELVRIILLRRGVGPG